MVVPSLDAGANYVPPTSEAIAAAQNERDGLHLLLAQRRLYAVAKRWALMRSIGFSVVAVGAPLITVAWPSLSVGVGAFTGLWIFFSRGAFVGAERGYAARGAVIQELFDLRIFGMPQFAAREPRVTPEDISRLVGDEQRFTMAVEKEKLRDWYPIHKDLDGGAAIAIAQRANAAYSERLLRSSAFIWLTLTVAWSAIAVIISVTLGLTLEDFMLGVAFPLLPALLDVFDQWRITKHAGAERRALAQAIENSIKQEDGAAWTAQDLLIWQEQLFALRRDSPQIPSLVYRRTRKNNERDMNAAAGELAAAARTRGSTGPTTFVGTS
jgi:hypothetical protein